MPPNRRFIIHVIVYVSTQLHYYRYILFLFPSVYLDQIPQVFKSSSNLQLSLFQFKFIK